MSSKKLTATEIRATLSAMSKRSASIIRFGACASLFAIFGNSLYGTYTDYAQRGSASLESRKMTAIQGRLEQISGPYELGEPAEALVRSVYRVADDVYEVRFREDEFAAYGGMLAASADVFRRTIRQTDGMPRTAEHEELANQVAESVHPVLLLANSGFFRSEADAKTFVRKLASDRLLRDIAVTDPTRFFDADLIARLTDSPIWRQAYAARSEAELFDLAARYGMESARSFSPEAIVMREQVANALALAVGGDTIDIAPQLATADFAGYKLVSYLLTQMPYSDNTKGIGHRLANVVMPGAAQSMLAQSAVPLTDRQVLARIAEGLWHQTALAVTQPPQRLSDTAYRAGPGDNAISEVFSYDR